MDPFINTLLLLMVFWGFVWLVSFSWKIQYIELKTGIVKLEGKRTLGSWEFEGFAVETAFGLEGSAERALLKSSLS